jgi:hypothetical protein
MRLTDMFCDNGLIELAQGRFGSEVRHTATSYEASDLCSLTADHCLCR